MKLTIYLPKWQFWRRLSPNWSDFRIMAAITKSVSILKNFYNRSYHNLFFRFLGIFMSDLGLHLNCPINELRMSSIEVSSQWEGFFHLLMGVRQLIIQFSKSVLDIVNLALYILYIIALKRTSNMSSFAQITVNKVTETGDQKQIFYQYI